jgi:HK97 family phage major capsid protein
MQNEVELKAASMRIAEEVKSTLADDKMSAAEKSARLDNIEVENDRIGTDLKNLARAKALMVGGGESIEPPVEAKAYVPFSLGDEVARSAEYKSAQDSALSRQRFSRSIEIGTKAQGAPNLMGEGVSGTTAAAAPNGQFLSGVGGVGILPNYLPGVVQQRFYPLTITDLFASGSTDSPIISYVKETAWTNNAAAVAEGATKPYSSTTIARLQEQVGKIANLHKITDEMVMDAPQFRSFLDMRLVMGVQRQEEVQVLAGNGYPGVNGILNRSSGFTQGMTATTGTNVVFPSAGTPGEGTSSATVASVSYGRQITGATGKAVDGAPIADTIFQALTDIRFNSFTEPDAVVMNPLDWQTVRLAKDGQGQYLGGSFFGGDYGQTQNAGHSLWGLKVVVTPAMPQGSVLVGAFADSGQVFRRQGITVEMSNSNGTDFEQNLITVRAESRLALAVYRPSAFELVQLIHG